MADSSGNIEVAGLFSGTVAKFRHDDPGGRRPRTDVAKLTSRGERRLGRPDDRGGDPGRLGCKVAVAPDGSGGAYIAGSYMGLMTVGRTALSAVGQTEAFAAPQFVRLGHSRASTTGLAGSVAGMGHGLAVARRAAW